MDFLAALRNEVFRPLASVVLPGVLAVSPFAIVACNAMPDALRFYQTQATWFLLALVGCGTIAGMLLEDIGSGIERGIDRCMDLEYLYGHEKVWLTYLSCGTVDNNGRRYLGAVVTRLKFLNSLMPALFFFMLGIIALHFQTELWESHSVLLFCVGVICLLSWIFRTSTELSEVASTTRYCLLKPEQQPMEYDVNAITVRRIRHFAYAVGEVLTSRASDIDLRGHSSFAVVPQAILIFLGMKRTKTVVPAPHNAEREDS